MTLLSAHSVVATPTAAELTPWTATQAFQLPSMKIVATSITLMVTAPSTSTFRVTTGIGRVATMVVPQANALMISEGLVLQLHCRDYDSSSAV